MSDAGDFNGSVFFSTLLTLRDADKENVDVGLLPRVNSVNVSCKSKCFSSASSTLTSCYSHTFTFQFNFHKFIFLHLHF